MKVMKVIGIIAVGLGALLILVVSLSAVKTTFVCEGQLSTDGAPATETIYIKLEEYRWWVGQWSDSDASMHIEIPNTLVKYYGDVRRVGDQFQIYSQDQHKGNFSSLSKRLLLDIPSGKFEGECEQQG